MKAPVLLIGFNRPDNMCQVFEQIKKARKRNASNVEIWLSRLIGSVNYIHCFVKRMQAVH